MSKKRKWIFRGGTVLVILIIAVIMFITGRGHTVYIDNKSLEYNGESYNALQKVEVWVGDKRLSKLAKRERTSSTVIGQSFEMKLINTVNKGDEPTEVVVKLNLPYGWDGIVINVPGYLALSLNGKKDNILTEKDTAGKGKHRLHSHQRVKEPKYGKKHGN